MKAICVPKDAHCRIIPLSGIAPGKETGKSPVQFDAPIIDQAGQHFLLEQKQALP